MANLKIRSSECAWQHATVVLLNRKLTGVRGWMLNTSVEKEYVYGAGNEPIDINEGNATYTGSVTLLGYELDALDRAAQAAGYDNITRVPHELITMVVKMQKTPADPLVMYSVTGISIEGQEDSQNQNDKNREITLSFKAMYIGKTVV